MREEQFNRLPSQGNIYSTTRLGDVTIVGSGNHGKLYALTSRTCLEEVQLSDLPDDVEIIAVDSFQDTFPVLALTYVQKTTRSTFDDSLTSYIQIYSNWTHSDQGSPVSTTSSSSQSSTCSTPVKAGLPKEDFNTGQLGRIGQYCTAIKLSFIPYHLYHVLVQKANGTYGTVFLLSGSDNKIHTYEPIGNKMSFAEVPTKNYFPELARTFGAVVTRIQIECVNSLRKRITMCGCEDGVLKAFIISGAATPTWTPVSTPEECLNEDDEPFTETDDDDLASYGSATVEKVTNYFEGMITSIEFYIDGFSVNAVVASSLSPTYLYTNIIEESFKAGGCLKFSSRWDCVESVCVADVDFDGRAEIIIGTFGCTLLVYKFNDEIQQWVIVSYKKFPSTIFSIAFIDSILQVVSGSGIHHMKYTTAPYFKKHGSVSGEPNPDLSLEISQISISSAEDFSTKDLEVEGELQGATISTTPADDDQVAENLPCT